MRKPIIVAVFGVVFLAMGILFLSYSSGISSFAHSRKGWECPWWAGGCYPGSNTTGTDIQYPEAIELSNSKPITVSAYIWNIDESEFSCPTPLQTIKSIDYQAQLLTAGVEISPESIQLSTDNTMYADDTIFTNDTGMPTFDSETDTSSIPEGGMRESSALYTWIVYPNQAGTYAFHLRVSATTQGCQLFTLDDNFEIKVVDVFGLTARQLKILGFISGFLGSMLTLPGILAIIAKRKENRIERTKFETRSYRKRRKV
jgi:hypothetical protein